MASRFHRVRKSPWLRIMTFDTGRLWMPKKEENKGSDKRPLVLVSDGLPVWCVSCWIGSLSGLWTRDGGSR